MRKKKTIFYWIFDVLFWLSFILAFLLKITGLELHQWLGVGLGLFTIIHLFSHLGWVERISLNFFGKTSWRMRLYYLLDVGILMGFILILLTGLLISSWLNLTLAHYDLWRNIHVTFSVMTLLLVILKIALHWKWIVSPFIKVKQIPVPSTRLIPSPVLVTAPNHPGKTYTRRQFLGLMGMVSAGTVLALGSVYSDKNQTLADNIEVNTTTSSSPVSSAFIKNTPPSIPAVSTAATTQKSTVTPIVQDQTSNSASSDLVCTQRCPKGQHCSFPGRCSRYTDSDNNGRCDLGECS